MQETPAALLDQLVYIDNFLTNSDTPNLDADGQLSLDLAAFADEAFIFADEEKPNKPYSDDEAHDEQLDTEEGPSWLHEGQNRLPNLDMAKKLLETNESKGPGGHESDYNDLDHIETDDRSSFGGFNNQDNTWLEQSRNPQNHFNAYNNAEKSKNVKLSKVTRYGNHDHFVSSPPKPAENEPSDSSIPDLSNVPKFPVPPGAEMSLKQAGLSLNQIDLLSALIAQHQTSMGNEKLTSNARNVSINQRSNSLPGGKIAQHLPPPPQAASDLTSNSVLKIPDRPHPHSSNLVKIESPGSVNGSEYSSGSVSGHQTPISSNGGISSELDKKRRSLAASARFRIKKKLKEKELEEQISQLNDLVRNFELKIDELELENRLLKNLIIEKGNQDSDQELKRLKERAKYPSKE